MALQFENAASASFKVQPEGTSKQITLKGINSTVQSASVICDGVASLLAIGGITGVYEGAARVVTEDVYDDQS